MITEVLKNISYDFVLAEDYFGHVCVFDLFIESGFGIKTYSNTTSTQF